MAGAMCLWVIRALTELIAFLAQVQGMTLQHAVREGRLGPCPQAPQTLGKSTVTRGVLRLPPPFVDLSKRLPQRFGGPLTDVKKGRETTQDDRHVGAQGLPSALRRLPASRIDRLRRLRGLQGLRVAGQNAIRFLPGCLGG
jgi:hypothetical protein